MNNILWDLIDKAFLAIEGKDLIHAKEIVNLIRREYPKQPEVLYLSGLISYINNDYNKALEELYLALRAFPYNEKIYNIIGKIFFKKGIYKKSKIYFQRSITLNTKAAEIWFLMGCISEEEKNYTKAILFYKKSIEVEKDLVCDPFFNIAKIYDEIKEKEKSIIYLKNCIKINPDFSNAYLLLGTSKSLENSNIAKNAFQLHHENIPSIKGIEHAKCKGNEDYVQFNNDFITNLPKDLVFVPSYSSRQDPKFRNIIFNHTPKTGGRYFGNPLWECIRKYYYENTYKSLGFSLPNEKLKKETKILSCDRISMCEYKEGLMNYISKSTGSILDYSLLMTHGVNHNDLYKLLSEKYSIIPFRICTYRDPKMRLKSALNHLWLNSNGNIEYIEECIKERDWLLENAIYRTMFSDFDSDCSNQSSILKIDSLINADDPKILAHIQSIILSSLRLPNILTYRRIHSKIKKNNTIPKILLDKFQSKCIDLGFISKDEDSLFSTLKESSINLLKSPLKIEKSNRIHPMTLIFEPELHHGLTKNSYFLKTKDLSSLEYRDIIKGIK